MPTARCSSRFFHVEVGAVARERYLADDSHAEDAGNRTRPALAARRLLPGQGRPRRRGGLGRVPAGSPSCRTTSPRPSAGTMSRARSPTSPFSSGRPPMSASSVERDEHGEEQVTYTGVFLLQDDFDHALERMPGGDRDAQRLPIRVTAVDFGDGPVIRCPFCNRTSPLARRVARGRGGPDHVSAGGVRRRAEGEPVRRGRCSHLIDGGAGSIAADRRALHDFRPLPGGCAVPYGWVG